jgi:hypothetical protein
MQTKPRTAPAILAAVIVTAALAANPTTAALAATPAISAPPPAGPRFVADLDFTSCDGLICLPVTLDDGSRQVMLLDTGNVNSYVAADTARAKGWPLLPVLGGDGKPVAGLSKTSRHTLHLGGLSLPVAMLVFDRKDMGPGKLPFDGGLVFTALADRIVEIDFAHHRLRISDVLTDPVPSAASAPPVPAGSSPAPATAFAGRLSTIHFGKQGPPILTGGPFTVDGKPVQAQIDTAFTGTMVIYDAAIPALGLAPTAKAAAGHGQVFPYTDGGVTMLAAPAQSLGFASRILHDHAPTLYFPTPGVHQPDGLFEATVGTAFFDGMVLTLDLHHMTFDVRPAGR